MPHLSMDPHDLSQSPRLRPALVCWRLSWPESWFLVEQLDSDLSVVGSQRFGIALLAGGAGF